MWPFALRAKSRKPSVGGPGQGEPFFRWAFWKKDFHPKLSFHKHFPLKEEGLLNQKEKT